MNLVQALLAGAAAGLAASAAMSRFHALLQPPPAEQPDQQGQEDSTVKAAAAVSRTVFHHELTPAEKKPASYAVHYGLGAGLGALYGVLVESAPPLRSGWGLPFGAAVWLGAHVLAVPALGLSPPVTRSTPRQESVELGAHLVFGSVTELLRRFLRTHALAR